MVKIIMAGGGQFAELEKFADRMRDATTINPDVLRGLQSLHPSAVEAAASMQAFATSVRNIKWSQIMGRALRSNYTVNIYNYQSQSAELRRATQLEF